MLSYRARVTLSLVSLATIAATATGILVGRSSSDRLTAELARRLEGVVSTASLRIDGDMFAKIQNAEHPYARLLKAELAATATANHGIANLYTGRVDDENLTFIVDGYAEDGQYAPYGETYPIEREMKVAFGGQATTNPSIVTDKYGSWISGYAPIRNGAGDVVAIVGADMDAATVRLAWWGVARTTGLTVLIVLVASLLLALLLARHIMRPMDELLAGFHRLEDGDPGTTVDITSPPEFARLAASFNRAEKSVQERDTIKGIFGTFLEKHVAKKVLADVGPNGIPGEMRRVSILFSDIRGYTSWSEDKHPMELLEALNSYFTAMIDVTLTQHGTIDKFIGDALMVLFGAPTNSESHADHAVLAAIGMQRVISRSTFPFSVGIGINTADVVLGTVGSAKRMSYTAMGDGVNLAQRLESKAAPGQIIITRETFQALLHPERFDIVPIPAIQVKGKAAPIDVLEVRGLAKRGVTRASTTTRPAKGARVKTPTRTRVSPARRRR